MSVVTVDPEHPLPQYRSNDAALAHFKNLLAARTKPDGTPKQGFTRNVALLRREIAAMEGRSVEVEQAGEVTAVDSDHDDSGSER